VGAKWMNLAQDRYKLRAIVNTEMNIWVMQNAGSFLNAKRLSAFRGVSFFVLSRAFSRSM
jgi:hypothetical protein